MKSKRSYDSALRREQAEATRERILEAVSQLVAAGAVQDLTVPKVAERAGVTVRTVYRYFPARADLIDAMQQWALRRLGAPAWPRDVAGLLALPVPLFEGFDRNRELVEAQLRGGPLAEVRREGKERRVLALRGTLASALEGLPVETQRAALGVIKHLLSATAWQSLREDVGMDGAEAGRAVAWAIGVLVRDLEGQREAALQKAGGRDGRGAGGSSGPGGRRRGGAEKRPIRRARGG